MDAFQFPLLLYGSQPSSSRRAWRKILKAALATKSWDAALAGQPFQDVRECPGDIIVEGSPGEAPSWRREQSHWWLTLVGDVPLFDENVLPRETVLFGQQLIVSGCKYLWFTMGYLGSQHHDYPHLLGVSEEAYEHNERQFHGSIANAVVYWMPEIQELCNRICTVNLSADFVVPGTVMRFWVLSVLMILRRARLPVGIVRQMSMDWDEHQGDLVKFLLLAKVIRPVGDRYQLVTGPD